MVQDEFNGMAADWRRLAATAEAQEEAESV
jgi:hypothetical protein